MVQSSDYQTAVITGTTGGVTGGSLIPPEYEGIIHDIEYAELQNTGTTVTVRVQPSGTNIDVKSLTAMQSLIPGAAGEPNAVFGKIPRSSVLQVQTSVSDVVVKVIFTIEESRFA